MKTRRSQSQTLKYGGHLHRTNRSRLITGPTTLTGWEKRNKQMDAVMQRGSEVRRGVTTAEDPIQGSRTVSNDYNYCWTRPDGSIVGTRTDTPPDYNNGWRMMTTR